MFVILGVVVAIGIDVTLNPDLLVVESAPGSYGASASGGVVAAIFSLAIFLPGLAVTVRRLHDVDRSGWWILIGLVPLVGFIVLIVWYCTKGTDGRNRFGEDPMDGR